MTALILGAGSDIALEIVRRLPPQRTLLAARRPEEVVARVTAMGLAGTTAVPIEWDALDVEGHAATMAALVEEHGPIDVVVMAVGLLGHHAGASMGPVDVDHMIRTNTAGPAAALAAVAPQLAPGATVVVLSSVAGIRPRKSNYVYGSSKAGLDAFALGLADALVERDVKVLVVRPGFVTSKMTEGLEPAPFATTADVVGEAVAAAVARGRGGVLYVPGVLRALFGVIRLLPTALWRRISGDR